MYIRFPSSARNGMKSLTATNYIFPVYGGSSQEFRLMRIFVACWVVTFIFKSFYVYFHFSPQMASAALKGHWNPMRIMSSQRLAIGRWVTCFSWEVARQSYTSLKKMFDFLLLHDLETVLVMIWIFDKRCYALKLTRWILPGLLV